MAGEVYRYNPTLSSEVKFPAYYDNSLFIYEWMRDWIKVVKLDEHGDRVSIEPFMPSAQFSSPMDMEFVKMAPCTYSNTALAGTAIIRMPG